MQVELSLKGALITGSLKPGARLITKEIADKLSVSEQTVKNQLTDILKRLRKEISRENFCL